MLLITAPSKTQEPIFPAPDTYTTPVFLKQSEELIKILHQYSIDELCALMKMSAKLGESTREKIEKFTLPLTPDNSHPALFTFQGDAYSGLTPTVYSNEELKHGQDHVRILSGLYGILKPLDLMHPYRLEMGLKLATADFANLYQFWGDLLTEQVNKECEEKGFTTLVNLASNEYSRAINKKLLAPEFLTVTFKEKKEESYKTVPIYSKRARGMMIDFAIRERLTRAEQLKSFTVDGYALSQELSSIKEWVFTRD